MLSPEGEDRVGENRARMFLGFPRFSGHAGEGAIGMF
jgi:hypothetical protein